MATRIPFHTGIVSRVELTAIRWRILMHRIGDIVLLAVLLVAAMAGIVAAIEGWKGRNMRRLPIILVIFGTAISISPAISQQGKSTADSDAKLNDVVQECVHYVRNMPNPNPVYGDSYKHFDAYYNSATGKVENNAFLNVDQQATYVFRQCMAAHKFPLR